MLWVECVASISGIRNETHRNLYSKYQKEIDYFENIGEMRG
jgi:hypothetical protein